MKIADVQITGDTLEKFLSWNKQGQVDFIYKINKMPRKEIEKHLTNIPYGTISKRVPKEIKQVEQPVVGSDNETDSPIGQPDTEGVKEKRTSKRKKTKQ